MNNLAWELVRLCVACGAETFKGCTVCKACGVVDENGIQYLQTSKRRVIFRTEQVDGSCKAVFFCYQWSGIGADPVRYLQPHRRLTEVAEDSPLLVEARFGGRRLHADLTTLEYEKWRVEYLERVKELALKKMEYTVSPPVEAEGTPPMLIATSKPLSHTQLWLVLMFGVGVAVIIINLFF